MPFAPHRIARVLLALALAAACAVVAGCASARNDTRLAGAAAGPRLAPEDLVFAMQAAGGGQYEVEAGRLAAARAERPEVRALGQMLVDHHTASNAELTAVLQARGMAPPSIVPPQFEGKLARLAAAPAGAFDPLFVRTAGLDDHAQQIGLFEQASREVRDPALKGWFVKTLPALRAHYNAAQTIAGQLAG